jgi:hypothetical protein
MEQKTNYKILKLRSGEEIIGKIVNSSKTKLTIERPMSFRFLMIQDYNGVPKEVIVAKSWAVLSIDNQVDIPSDFVVSFMNPSPEAITLYESEKTKQDVHVKLPKEEKNLDKDLDKDLDKIKKDYDDAIKQLEQDEDFKKMMRMMAENARNTVDDMKNEKEKNKKEEDMIFMNMMFPPEMLIDLIESEMIDPEVFGEMYQDIKKNMKKKKKPESPKNKKSPKNGMMEGNSSKFTGDQKDHKDYGNRWTDWNPDLSSEDYQ